MITDRLYDLAAHMPDAPFVFYKEDVISFSQMADMVSAQAAALSAAGVKEGQNVAMLCSNRPGFLVTWFALTELGAVTVPLNTGLVGEGLRYSLEQSDAVMLLIEPALAETKRDDLAALSPTLPCRAIDEAIETIPLQEVARMRRGTGAPDALNMILYTSGTTGLPKGAMIPNGAFELAGDDMRDSLSLTPQDRIMVFLPLFHANPQMYAVASTLATGASMVLIERFSASDFLPAARHYGATGFTFVGTVLGILDKRHPEINQDHSLRFGVGGGASPVIWKNIEEKFGTRLFELYGMTETGGWVTMNTADSYRFGSVGRPRKGVTIRVVDDARTEVAAGEKGEITARSSRSNLFFSGYWKKPEVTAEIMAGDWLNTGDRGWKDEDGFLYFDSRLKELIRRSGEMISPVEIELQLLKHPAVQDCAVIGIPDDLLGEEIKAFVVLAKTVKAQELASFLTGKIPIALQPRYFAFIDAIPKTETEKIKRHELMHNNRNVIDLHAPLQPEKRA